MGRVVSVISVVLLAFVVLTAQAPAPNASQDALPGLDGYTRDGARAERDWEAKMRAIPSTDNLRESLRRLSARPHAVGQPYDKDNAEWLLSKFREYGWDAHIETFDVLFPTPKDRAVELVEPHRFVAKLAEPPVAADPTSNQTAEQLPTYNAYSADGDVTAPLIYVNYGGPDDYEVLQRAGVSVKGAIVIARYGGGWRGVKPMVANQHGAIGCLIYSDPADDGYGEGAQYPEGPYRPPDGVQRGSVEMSYYPGDPLTPGWGSTPGAKRLARSDAEVIQKIPVIAISYADAQPLLAAIGGRVAPENWRGGLPITYRIGPGPARVHLKMFSNWETKTLYDVIATLHGTSTADQASDQWVIRGNHHDAWVNGASDPLSGMVAELEEARALGALVKSGWKPKRTIIYAAWDGEEPGLLGSTEWAETHGDELQQHAAVYINSDSNGRGYLSMGGSHSLEHFINGVAREIPDPETDLTAWKRDQLRAIGRARNADDRQEARTRGDLRIGALGDGSDYATFLDHFGIATLSLGYGGEGGGGVYHSIYDDFYWYTHYSDTNFVYGRAMSQTAATAVMRLADADVIPYDFVDLADTLKRYLKELDKLAKDKNDAAKERAAELQEGVFTATSDPHQPTLAPPALSEPPTFDFKPLQDAMDIITLNADRYTKAIARLRDAQSLSDADAAALADINKTLLQAERKLLSDQGLPQRPWYRHMIYAPGLYTGYASKPIPAVREALEEDRWSDAQASIPRVAHVLQEEAAVIALAAEKLEKLTKP